MYRGYRSIPAGGGLIVLGLHPGSITGWGLTDLGGSRLRPCVDELGLLAVRLGTLVAPALLAGGGILGQVGSPRQCPN